MFGAPRFKNSPAYFHSQLKLLRTFRCITKTRDPSTTPTAKRSSDMHPIRVPATELSDPSSAGALPNLISTVIFILPRDTA
jgi:hypothetical protein